MASSLAACSDTTPQDTPIIIIDTSDRSIEFDTGTDQSQDVVIVDVVEEPLFVPPQIAGWTVAKDINDDPDIVEINLTAQYKNVDVGEGRTINMMTYNGEFPGPLIQAKVGDRVIINFKNELNEPTTIHWHGLRISDKMDGSPRVQDPVKANGTFKYDFVVPEAGSFWYHPHVRTHEQVEKGLYGGFIVHDPADPVVDVERFIVLDDILLTQDNQIAPFDLRGHQAMMGRTGNVLLINGNSTLPAKSDIVGKTERWRIVNVANARTFYIEMKGDKPMKVVGTDGGLMDEPYTASLIEVAVGQRYDLEIINESNSESLLEGRFVGTDENGQRVEYTIPFYSVSPEDLPASAPKLDWKRPLNLNSNVDREVTMEFDAYRDDSGLVWTINGKANSPDPVFTFKNGEVIDMTIVNKQGPVHPFHLHGQFFSILDNGYGDSVPGLKDTVLVPGERTVKIRAYYNNPGHWMAHCHILEHAALGMMSEIFVDP